jgi:NADH-dependent peroxiredoxin subunit F
MPESDSVFDVAIIGYGPAAITAGIYTARKKLNVVLIGDLPGGEVRNSGEIENWPGDGVTNGNELAEKMVKHLASHQDQVKILTTKVEKITKKDELFRIKTEDGQDLKSRTVIYATGRHPRYLDVPGEDMFRNRGVTYCATCDAPLFQDKTVAVIGGGNTGAEAVIMLQKIAKKIYLIHLNDTLTADSILVQKFKDDSKVEIIYNGKTEEILGDGLVNGLKYKDQKSGEIKQLDVEGIFVAIGSLPNTKPVGDIVKLDKFGAVKTDRYGRTDVDGFFAAGDVTDIRDAQITVAAGHGCSAALSAGDFLARN